MTGGRISGNIAQSSYGGGVCVYYDTLTKTAGIIYGLGASSTLQNTAYNDNYGHAVYVYASSKKRNTTAGETVTLDSAKSGAAGGWE